MINANDYTSTEDLKAAMMQEHKTQILEIMMSKLRSLNADISQIQSLTNYPFANEVASLKRTEIYWKIDRIEELAKRLVYTASSMKSVCRFIPKDDI